MCRLLAIIGTTNSKLAHEFIDGAIEEMIKGNKDGIGLMMTTKDGNIDYHKWVKPEHFKDTTSFIEFNNKMSVLKDVISMDTSNDLYKGNNNFIDIENSKTICVHTRHATNGINIDNTHPIVNKGIHLMHNGVINNHFMFNKTVSTNDTEAILERYITYNMQYNPDNLQNLLTDLKGWQAVLAMSKLDDNTPILDIWKDETSPLVVTFIDELGSFVFASTEKIIHEGCRKILTETPKIVKVKPYSYIRFNALTGEIIFQKSIPKPAIVIESKPDKRSKHKNHNTKTYELHNFYSNDYIIEEDLFNEKKKQLTDYERSLLDMFDIGTQHDILLYSDLSVTEAYKVLRGEIKTSSNF